jgi:DNA-binding winged helix-turn-helix (wHTH) protein/predicted ATPase/type II secretory pathway predicted ATPase ExeA
MTVARHLLFPPFRLDPANERLWHGTQEIVLRRKTFAVLRYLVERPDQLVSKAELLQAVWPSTYVSDVVLTGCIRDLRKALGDRPHAPRFIETVHRRGYRFIAPVTTTPPVVSQQLSVVSQQKPATPSQLATGNWQLATRLVGREAELAQLHGWLEKALRGERQIIFVTGEAGIGKTALVEAFLMGIEGWGLGVGPSSPLVSSLKPQASNFWIARGQCVEQYGVGEAYLPILSALGQLCREPEGERLISLLAQHAPTWLVQMPAFLSTAELETLQRRVLGASRERMLREMAEALEVLTAERPLVLKLEDLQWSDVSTLDLLSVVARPSGPARLLIIGTYRPTDVNTGGHPLQTITQDLQLHRLCEELPLEFMTESAVSEYLTVRFGVGAPGQWKSQAEAVPLRGLVQAIHQRTDGNPLFMVSVVDYLVAQELLVWREGQWELQRDLTEIGVPEGLRQMIEKQIERLGVAEQRVLEAASVAGGEFSAAAVAAAVEQDPLQVEEQCEGLVRRRRFLQSCGSGEWPDGTVAARYSFIHALYQNVLYERVTVGRRIRLHRQIGERVATGHGARADEIAAELAVHFECGRDYGRAVHYLRQAAENATRRYAYREAMRHVSTGLGLLKALPDTSERIQQELALQTILGLALTATKGYADPEVEQVYTRARELGQQVGETPQLFPILWGLWAFCVVRAELQIARELAERLLTLAQGLQDAALLLEAHRAVGETLYYLGESTAAYEHLRQGLRFSDLQQRRPFAFLQANDPAVTCLAIETSVLWYRGYSDQALARSHETLTLAQQLTHPLNLAGTLFLAAWLRQCRREGQATQERAEALITLSTEQGFPFWLATGTILQGWARVKQGHRKEGIVQMRQSLDAYRATGAKLWEPHWLALLAEAYGETGQIQEGLTLLAEALALINDTGEQYYEAELYRLKGELMLKSKVQGPKSITGQAEIFTKIGHKSSDQKR